MTRFGKLTLVIDVQSANNDSPPSVRMLSETSSVKDEQPLNVYVMYGVVIFCRSGLMFVIDEQYLNE